MNSTLKGMRLDGISAYLPEQVWSNARVAARLRLERIRLRAAERRQVTPEEAKLFQTSDRWSGRTSAISRTGIGWWPSAPR